MFHLFPLQLRFWGFVFLRLYMFSISVRPSPSLSAFLCPFVCLLHSLLPPSWEAFTSAKAVRSSRQSFEGRVKD